MKKKFLTFIPTIFMLCSCEISFFNKKEQVHVDHQTIIDDVDPDPITQHATSTSAEPNAPFYLKVGETKELKMTLSPSPTIDSEKEFSWKVEGESYATLTVDSKDSRKATILGVKEGNVKVTATNVFNYDLKKTFTIKVIDFDEENAYLWQYASSDRAQFGYNSQGPKEGTTDGVATLGGKDWTYSRSIASSLQTSMGAIGFGKGSAPETHVHLETENDRLVSKIIIEAASANSLAKMTVKVGDLTVFNNVTVEKDDYDVIGTLESPSCSAAGKISIDFETPEYDSSREDDPSYKKPGAVYLKSIMILYQVEKIEKIEIAPDSKHIVDYTKGSIFSEEGIKLQKVTTRGTTFLVDIEEEQKNQNLTFNYPSLDLASHEAKDVIISLKVKGYEEPFKCSYKIHIRDDAWTPEAIKVVGTVAKQNLTAGDEVDYSGLKINVIYSTEPEDILTMPFELCDTFTFVYAGDGDPLVAETQMVAGYTMTIIGHFVPDADGVRSVTVGTTFTVPANTLSVKDAIFDRIDFRKESVRKDSGITSEYQQISFKPTQESKCRIDFDRVQKGNRLADNLELPSTLSNFDVVVTNKNYTIEKLNVEFANVSKRENNYRLFASVYGGDILTSETELAQAESHKIIYNDFPQYTNCAHFEPGLSGTGTPINGRTGIVSILVRYAEVSHKEYTISAGSTVPSKLTYTEGETFDPTDLTINLIDSASSESYEITKFIEWFDGSTYSKEPQKTLLPASTYVIGVFHEKTIQINITSVQEKHIELTKVTDISQITAEGKYYITCPESYLVLKGSTKNGDLLSGKGCGQEITTFGNTLNLNILFENDYFEIAPTGNETFTIRTNYEDPAKRGYLGLTKGGSPSCSANIPNKEFTIDINSSGIATVKITAEGFDSNDVSKGVFTYYLGGTSELIKLYTTDKANIVIYKLN